jgi:hypothetical protein
MAVSIPSDTPEYPPPDGQRTTPIPPQPVTKVREATRRSLIETRALLDADCIAGLEWASTEQEERTMDTVTITVLLSIVAAPIALMVLLEVRDRRARHTAPTAGGDGDDQSIRERARAEQEGERSRGQAAGSAYGTGIGGDAP